MSTTMSVPVAPASPAVTEFDLVIEQERARWLRRRFIWFCAVNITLYTLIFLIFASDIYHSRPLAKVFNLIDFVLIVGGYAAALVYVRGHKLPLDRLLRLALYITATLPALSIVFTRLDVELNRPAYDWISDRLPPGAVWAIASPGSMLFAFTIACALVPWTVGEALKPAAALLAANAAVIGFDLLVTLNDQPQARGVARNFLIASPLALLPGLFICYLRFSRFRRTV